MSTDHLDWSTNTVGLLAQLVKHYTGIAKVMGSNPVQALFIFIFYFFSGLLFTTAYVVFITAKIAFIFTVDNVNWPPWRVCTRVYNLLKLIRRILYNISIHLLHTLPYTFPKVRRIRWKIKASWVLRSFPLFSGFKRI